MEDNIKATVDGEITFKYQMTDYGKRKDTMSVEDVKLNVKNNIERYLLDYFQLVEILESDLEIKIEEV